MRFAARSAEPITSLLFCIATNCLATPIARDSCLSASPAVIMICAATSAQMIGAVRGSPPPRNPANQLTQRQLTNLRAPRRREARSAHVTSAIKVPDRSLLTSAAAAVSIMSYTACNSRS